MPHHVFITGVAGFIGSSLAHRLLQQGIRVSGVDAFITEGENSRLHDNLAPLRDHPRFRFAPIDIRDAAALTAFVAEAKPEVVVHLGAVAGVRASLLQPAMYTDINVTGTVHVLEAMRAAGCTRLVFASSSSVYGARTQGPFSESDPVDLTASPYAATKRAGELLCSTYHHVYGLHATCLRFFTVYGPRQRPEMAIHHFVRCIEADRPVPMFGDGSSIRDYTYVSDILDGIEAAIRTPLGYAVLNLGGDFPVSLRTLIDTIGQAMDRPVTIQALPNQPGDVPYTAADLTRARTLLGYTPKVTLEDGIRQFLAWRKEQR